VDLILPPTKIKNAAGAGKVGGKLRKWDLFRQEDQRKGRDKDSIARGCGEKGIGENAWGNRDITQERGGHESMN